MAEWVGATRLCELCYFFKGLAPGKLRWYHSIFCFMNAKTDTQIPLFTEMLGLFIDEKGMMLDLGHSDVMSPILFNIFPKHLPGCRHQAAPQVRGRRKMWLYMAHSLLRDIDILIMSQQECGQLIQLTKVWEK